MPKCQFVDPKEMRKASEITFGTIPVNQYKKTLKQERKNYTDDQLLSIYQDMQYIREFETMLYEVRTAKHYNGIDYVYTGPAHLYSGEEATAVGMAYSLNNDDIIFGSHRSHGEVLAKGFNAIRNHTDEELYQIMKDTFDG